MRNHFLRAGGVPSSGGGGSSSAYISGKLHYYANGTGGFGAFWERESNGSLYDLEINPTGITAFNERTSGIQTSSSSAWTSFEIDLD